MRDMAAFVAAEIVRELGYSLIAPDEVRREARRGDQARGKGAEPSRHDLLAAILPAIDRAVDAP